MKPVLRENANYMKDDKKVKVYSTPICPFCITLKEFLKKREVDFEDIDISGNEEAKERVVKNTGQSSVPVLELDGKFIVGFNRKEISKLLNIE